MLCVTLLGCARTVSIGHFMAHESQSKPRSCLATYGESSPSVFNARRFVTKTRKAICMGLIERAARPSYSQAITALIDSLCERIAGSRSDKPRVATVRHCCYAKNNLSSRSHTVVTVVLETRRAGDGLVMNRGGHASSTGTSLRRSKLVLVDLAGSEQDGRPGCRGLVVGEKRT